MFKRNTQLLSLTALRTSGLCATILMRSSHALVLCLRGPLIPGAQAANSLQWPPQASAALTSALPATLASDLDSWNLTPRCLSCWPLIVLLCSDDGWLLTTSALSGTRHQILGPHTSVLRNTRALPCRNPSGADLAYVRDLLGDIEAYSIPAPAPIEQRWTAASRSDMSPAHSHTPPDPVFSWVGIIMYLPTEVPEQRRLITER